MKLIPPCVLAFICVLYLLPSSEDNPGPDIPSPSSVYVGAYDATVKSYGVRRSRVAAEFKRHVLDQLDEFAKLDKGQQSLAWVDAFKQAYNSPDTGKIDPTLPPDQQHWITGLQLEMAKYIGLRDPNDPESDVYDPATVKQFSTAIYDALRGKQPATN